ncbi:MULTISPECIES: YidC/Oxa1 family membrane protein insertase [Sporomusaceae]|uniref:YidC/Oxa1 family membrane protein insertase n=1 Tax=Sporomusaceae TaxID=1843490 RepID=UPI00036BF457|nr:MULTISPECIES: YidC/Oxa1 family membrane protein insertase [Sporomusaceae]
MFELFDSAILVLQDILNIFYQLTATLGFPSYGLAIILMTLVIKMLMYPLTVKQVKSMKGMQILQPKMKELQAKYKDKPEKLQQEMIKLYKETGVNPMAGCLPLVLQMPIFIIIFYGLRDFTFNGATSFLWLVDLAQPDPLYILPVLSALTTYYQQKQTSTEMNQQAKMMLMFMPLFIGYISTTFSSGLVLYWVTMNTVQIVQQWWMSREAA